MAEGVPTNNQRGQRPGPCRLWGGLDNRNIMISVKSVEILILINKSSFKRIILVTIMPHLKYSTIHTWLFQLSMSVTILITDSELQITFSVKGYLPPDFELNADFQNFRSIFTPYIFSQCWKLTILQFFSDLCIYDVCLKYSFGSDSLLPD